jgi:hypothetical protein
MQVFSAPEAFRLWSDDAEKEAALPFRYFITRFEGLPGPEELERVYTGLVRQAGEALGWDPQGKGEEAAPHNVVLDGRDGGGAETPAAVEVVRQQKAGLLVFDMLGGGVEVVRGCTAP